MKSVIAMLAIIILVICRCPVIAQERSVSDEDRAIFSSLIDHSNLTIDSTNKAIDAENNYRDQLMQTYKKNPKKGVFSYDVLNLMTQAERDSLCFLTMSSMKYEIIQDSVSSLCQVFALDHPGVYSKKELAKWLQKKATEKNNYINNIKNSNDFINEIKSYTPAKITANLAYSELLKKYRKQIARLHKSLADFNNFSQRANWGCILKQTMEEGGGSRDPGEDLLRSLSVQSLFKGKDKKSVTTSTRIHASRSDVNKGQQLCKIIEESLDEFEKVVYEVDSFINEQGAAMWNAKELAKNKRSIDTNKRQIIAQRKEVEKTKNQVGSM